MNFKKINPTMMVGMSKISKLKEGQALLIKEIKTGVPCLIVNGLVCDINGIPFPNSDFQEALSSISERVKVCKAIVTGKIVRRYSSYEQDGGDPFNYEFASALKRTAGSARTFDNFKIIAEDMFLTLSENTGAIHRMNMMNGMIVGVKAVDPTCPIEVTRVLHMDASTNKEILNFAEIAAKAASMIEIHDSMAKYKEQNKSVIIDLLELMTGKVESVKKIKTMGFGEIKASEKIEFIQVSCNNETVKISYHAKKYSASQKTLSLIEEKSIDSILFRAAMIDGKIKYARTL